jgi:hypothetical protein
MSDPFKILLKVTSEKPIHHKKLGLTEKSGKYRLGKAQRPQLKHDNGHLDLFNKRNPTLHDRASLIKWLAKLEASEVLCTATLGKNISACNDEDLSDANEAYRHFLFGNGADRIIDYEKYLKSDPSAVGLIRDLSIDFKKHAEIIGEDRIKFSLTSDVFTVGHRGISPYPTTANWQKTLGAHFLWVSADIAVSSDSTGKIWYDADVIIHVEDRYNFNPGGTDVATGIPDSENGMFEISGLAHQYTNFATVTRKFLWQKGKYD